MNASLYYLAASGIFCVLLWIPYILNRISVWGIPAFASNYPSKKFPAEAPAIPVWAERAQRTHLNMVETLPAFAAVVLAAYLSVDSNTIVAIWAAIFFWARVFHASVYILGVPYLQTPLYLASWAAVLAIGTQVVF
ncbi:MAPEG family protein [Acaryochloris sp. IP29b_bin.148]|uniref:MAPEG family protein n=1 Tax=Acaryochloris sp. IP29b_bin.148 TaxID=2969218 RepID=UPI00263106C6|nr:MAPEG family protein [Acaryochloris sp. IP29b_bin.148]